MATRVRIENDDLTPDLVEKAKRELRETPEQVKESVEKLRELIKNDKTLRFTDDEEILIRFLRPTKFYPESAYDLIKRVLDFKEKHKDMLENLLPQDEEKVFLNEDIVNVLVDRDQDGRRILLMKEGTDWEPSRVTAAQKFKMLYLLHLAAMLEPATQVNGIVVIIDFQGLGMKHVRALTPSHLLTLINFTQDAFPIRFKEVHIINQPFIFNIIWQICKPVINDKMKKRIFFHGKKLSSVHEYVKPEYLPKNYGGSLPPISYTAKDWYPHVTKFTDYYKQHNSYKIEKE